MIALSKKRFETSNFECFDVDGEINELFMMNLCTGLSACVVSIKMANGHSREYE